MQHTVKVTTHATPGSAPPRGRGGLLALAAGFTVACSAPPRAAPGPAAPRDAPASPPLSHPAGSPLAGTWTLTAADDLLPDGTRVQAFGSSPRGTLMIDDDGRYSLQIYRSDRPRFASDDKGKASAAEYQAAAMGMSSHIGHCEIDQASHLLVFRIEQSAFPNWNGTEQKRKFRLDGDDLSYQVPVSPNGRIPISEWHRVRTP